MKNKKLLNILLPAATTLAAGAVVLPLVGCSGTVEEGVVVTLTNSSTDGVKIKEVKAELNKESTITFETPSLKAVKTVSILMGDTQLKSSQYKIVDNTVTINADAMTSKDVKVTVFTKTINALYATVVYPEGRVEENEAYESLEAITDAGLKVVPVYDDNSKGTKNLTWKTEYAVYDGDEEITDFGTQGYKFTREDAEAGSKTLTLKYAPLDRYVGSVKINVIHRYEAHEIRAEDCSYCSYVIAGDTITANDLVIRATMTREPETNAPTKTLNWTDGDYKIFDGDEEITDFATTGYTFDSSLPKSSKTLTIKAEPFDEGCAKYQLGFDIQPASYKNKMVVTNTGGDGKFVWAIDAEQTAPVISYSRDGENWITPTPTTSQAIEIPLNTTDGNTIMFRGMNSTINTKTLTNTFKFVSDNPGNALNIKLYGSLIDLINYQHPEQVTELPEYCFKGLFELDESGNDENVITAVSPNFLGDGVVAVKESTCEDMFAKQRGLTIAPRLSATTLAKNCYKGMFSQTSLARAPYLPATTLADSCYIQMFNGCDKMFSAPALPATTLADNCYYQMFKDCFNLRNATDELPANELFSNSYQEMFFGCTDLTTAPVIKATIVGSYSCKSMFEGCMNLVNVQESLPAMQLGNNCYQAMFRNCHNLETMPALPATELAINCYESMFVDCFSLDCPITLNALELKKECYKNMFCCDSDQEMSLGYNGYDITIKATVLAENCCEGMFKNCANLSKAPELKVAELKDECYKQMFYGCIGLQVQDTTVEPEKNLILKGYSTEGVTDPYKEMFYGTVTEATDLPVVEGHYYSYQGQE